MAEASDFKFGKQFGFAKAHNKIIPRGKSGGGLGLGELLIILWFPVIFLQRLGIAILNLACSRGLQRHIIKSHAEKRVDMASG